MTGYGETCLRCTLGDMRCSCCPESPSAQAKRQCFCLCVICAMPSILCQNCCLQGPQISRQRDGTISSKYHGFHPCKERRQPTAAYPNRNPEYEGHVAYVYYCWGMPTLHKYLLSRPCCLYASVSGSDLCTILNSMH